MSLNLLQHLTGDNFQKTHNLRFVCYDFAAKDQNAITLAVMGLLGRSKRHTKGNFEEKNNNELTNSKKKKDDP